MSETSEIRKTFNFVILIVALMGIFVFAGFVFTVIRPILELTRETKKLESGDFSARVTIRFDDEIGQLGYRFNQMVSQIERLIDTKYKLKIQNKESELKALQTQISPHFLYNTLDMIRWTARLESATETGKSIEELSKLFRLSLSEGKYWIPLITEMTYVQSYLKLQKRRMGGQLNFLVTMEAGLETNLTMKLILEPLVENSIKHAFKQNQQNKCINVRAYKSSGDIYVEVIDNGSGMDVHHINTLLKRTEERNDEMGFGLKNVYDRIETAFGSYYGLNVIPVKQGTLVRICMPYIENKEQLKHLLESGEDKK